MEELQLLMKSLGLQVLDSESDPSGTVSILILETVKLRDKLKEETGYILTVEDTRNALEALESVLNKDPIPEGLTSEQKQLAQIWFDRMTLFKE